MSGSPPPTSSQLPSSPQGCYSRPRRSRKPPDWFGDSVSEVPDLVLSENEGESDDEDSFLQVGAGHQQHMQQLQAVADHAAALANRDIPAQHVDVQPPDLNAGRRDVQEVAGVRVDQVELSDWLYPEVPLAHPGMVADDAEGWNLIDRWDVWDCVLSEFPTMQDIPRAYMEVWAAAVAKVLRNIQAVDDGLQLERGLKWFLSLPKAAFRQAR